MEKYTAWSDGSYTDVYRKGYSSYKIVDSEGKVVAERAVKVENLALPKTKGTEGTIQTEELAFILMIQKIVELELEDVEIFTDSEYLIQKLKNTNSLMSSKMNGVLLRETFERVMGCPNSAKAMLRKVNWRTREENIAHGTFLVKDIYEVVDYNDVFVPTVKQAEQPMYEMKTQKVKKYDLTINQSFVELLEISLDSIHYFEKHRSIQRFLKETLRGSVSIVNEYFQGFVNDKFHFTVVGGEIVRLSITTDKKPSLLTKYYLQELDSQTIEVNLTIKQDKKKKTWIQQFGLLDFVAYVTCEQNGENKMIDENFDKHFIESFIKETNPKVKEEFLISDIETAEGIKISKKLLKNMYDHYSPEFSKAEVKRYLLEQLRTAEWVYNSDTKKVDKKGETFTFILTDGEINEISVKGLKFKSPVQIKKEQSKSKIKPAANIKPHKEQKVIAPKALPIKIEEKLKTEASLRPYQHEGVILGEQAWKRIKKWSLATTPQATVKRIKEILEEAVEVKLEEGEVMLYKDKAITLKGGNVIDVDINKKIYPPLYAKHKLVKLKEKHKMKFKPVFFQRYTHAFTNWTEEEKEYELFKRWDESIPYEGNSRIWKSDRFVLQENTIVAYDTRIDYMLHWAEQQRIKAQKI